MDVNTRKPLLIMTVGLPRSGKTTWARRQGLPIVNPDSIRLVVHNSRFYELMEPLIWAIVKIMILSLFKAGNGTVILDATNLKESRRESFKSPDYKIEYAIFDISAEECIRRAKHINDMEIIPIIKKMDKEKDPFPIDYLNAYPINQPPQKPILMEKYITVGVAFAEDGKHCESFCDQNVNGICRLFSMPDGVVGTLGTFEKLEIDEVGSVRLKDCLEWEFEQEE